MRAAVAVDWCTDMDTGLLADQFSGKVPVQRDGQVIWLDGEIPVSQLRAALGGTGLILTANREVLTITVPKRVAS